MAVSEGLNIDTSELQARPTLRGINAALKVAMQQDPNAAKSFLISYSNPSPEQEASEHSKIEAKKRIALRDMRHEHSPSRRILSRLFQREVKIA